MIHEDERDRDQDPPGEAAPLPWSAPDAASGPPADGDVVYAAAYDALRRQARQLFANEAPGHTLQPTALVHEAYLRLAGTADDHWQSRAHFMAVASRAMRRILIDHARTRSRQKRGRGWNRVTLSDAHELGAAGADFDLLDMIQLDRALQELEREHKRMGRVAEMRLFGGLSIEEIAAAVGVAKRTVEGDWAFIRRWLSDAMTAGDSGPRPDDTGLAADPPAT